MLGLDASGCNTVCRRSQQIPFVSKTWQHALLGQPHRESAIAWRASAAFCGAAALLAHRNHRRQRKHGDGVAQAVGVASSQGEACDIASPLLMVQNNEHEHLLDPASAAGGIGADSFSLALLLAAQLGDSWLAEWEEVVSKARKSAAENAQDQRSQLWESLIAYFGCRLHSCGETLEKFEVVALAFTLSLSSEEGGLVARELERCGVDRSLHATSGTRLGWLVNEFETTMAAAESLADLLRLPDEVFTRHSRLGGAAFDSHLFFSLADALGRGKNLTSKMRFGPLQLAATRAARVARLAQSINPVEGDDDVDAAIKAQAANEREESLRTSFAMVSEDVKPASLEDDASTGREKDSLESLEVDEAEAWEAAEACESNLVNDLSDAGDVHLDEMLESPSPTVEDNIAGVDDLPIMAYQRQILDEVSSKRVAIIVGSTGCGKSTQVPKFILDADASARILVTQPRRVAAREIARRVASELGAKLGGLVGYRIGGETAISRKTRLEFATIGYTLSWFVGRPEAFAGFSHIVLDEVHERSSDSEMLLTLIKLLLHVYPHVKVVLMSATVNSAIFSEYFSEHVEGGETIEPITVPGRTYPVQELFLDDLVQGDGQGLPHDLIQPEVWSLLSRAAADFNACCPQHVQDEDEDQLQRSQSMLRSPRVPVGMGAAAPALVKLYACEDSTLLIFLPGIAEIEDMADILKPLEAKQDSDGFSYKVFVLHSLVQRQEEVFRPPEGGTCHVVLASNIAESSLTLPNVSAILDFCLVRQVEYDDFQGVSRLRTVWCSQASAKQRAGRAGRTQPGLCLRLVSRKFFETVMPAFDTPEVLRTSLVNLVLKAKKIGETLCRVQEARGAELPVDVASLKAILRCLPEAPSSKKTAAAVQELAEVGALVENSFSADFTALGRFIEGLGLDVRLGRLVWLGFLFGCAPEAVVMAAACSCFDPFTTPSRQYSTSTKDYVEALRDSFLARKRYDAGTFSEPIMLLRLFQEWLHLYRRQAEYNNGWASSCACMAKKDEVNGFRMTQFVNTVLATCDRVLRLPLPKVRAKRKLEELVALLRPEGEDILNPPPVTDIFTADVPLLQATLAAAFSDQLLVSRRCMDPIRGPPRKEAEIMAAPSLLAPSDGGKNQKKKGTDGSEVVDADLLKLWRKKTRRKKKQKPVMIIDAFDVADASSAVDCPPLHAVQYAADYYQECGFEVVVLLEETMERSSIEALTEGQLAAQDAVAEDDDLAALAELAAAGVVILAATVTLTRMDLITDVIAREPRGLLLSRQRFPECVEQQSNPTKAQEWVDTHVVPFTVMDSELSFVLPTGALVTNKTGNVDIDKEEREEDATVSEDEGADDEDEEEEDALESGVEDEEVREAVEVNEASKLPYWKQIAEQQAALRTLPASLESAAMRAVCVELAEEETETYPGAVPFEKVSSVMGSMTNITPTAVLRANVKSRYAAAMFGKDKALLPPLASEVLQRPLGNPTLDEASCEMHLANMFSGGRSLCQLDDGTLMSRPQTPYRLSFFLPEKHKSAKAKQGMAAGLLELRNPVGLPCSVGPRQDFLLVAAALQMTETKASVRTNSATILQAPEFVFALTTVSPEQSGLQVRVRPPGAGAEDARVTGFKVGGWDLDLFGQSDTCHLPLKIVEVVNKVRQGIQSALLQEPEVQRWDDVGGRSVHQERRRLRPTSQLVASDMRELVDLLQDLQTQQFSDMVDTRKEKPKEKSRGKRSKKQEKRPKDEVQIPLVTAEAPAGQVRVLGDLELAELPQFAQKAARAGQTSKRKKGRRGKGFGM